MLTIENEESHASDMPFEDLFKQYYECCETDYMDR